MKTDHKRDFVLGLVVCALALIILFGILPWACLLYTSDAADE